MIHNFYTLALKKTVGVYSLMSKEFCLVAQLPPSSVFATFLLNEYKKCFLLLKFEYLVCNMSYFLDVYMTQGYTIAYQRNIVCLHCFASIMACCTFVVFLIS